MLSDPWLTNSRPNPRAVVRLFCFPYAGGRAAIYRNWPERLPPTVELWALEIPGRGGRLSEPPFTRMELLVKAIAPALLPFLDRPFAFFGHSMGAVIAYELARLLEREHGRPPGHLFVSGRRAPHLAEPRLHSYNLPDREFLEHLRHLNGTPEEVINNQELMQLMLPVLRADFELIQTYAYAQGAPLTCPLSALGGLEDRDVKRECLEAWREHTTARFALALFPGDHFFLHGAQPLLLHCLSQELTYLVVSIALN